MKRWGTVGVVLLAGIALCAAVLAWSFIVLVVVKQP